MKFAIILGFLAILASLGSALFFMLRKNGSDSDKDDSSDDDGQRRQRMLRALALRVGLSIALFIGILVAAKLGYLHPTGFQWGQ